MCIHVTDGLVVRTDISLTRNVLSCSVGHGLNPGRVYLGVHSTSVQVVHKPTNISADTIIEMFTQLYETRSLSM